MNTYSRITTFGNKYGNRSLFFVFWNVWVSRVDFYVRNAADSRELYSFSDQQIQVFLFSCSWHEAYAEIRHSTRSEVNKIRY